MNEIFILFIVLNFLQIFPCDLKNDFKILRFLELYFQTAQTQQR